MILDYVTFFEERKMVSLHTFNSSAISLASIVGLLFHLIHVPSHFNLCMCVSKLFFFFFFLRGGGGLTKDVYSQECNTWFNITIKVSYLYCLSCS